MKEYWNRPEATAESLVDGWFYTGDGAVMDEDGFVYIQDRLKDMIISGGENVYPAELEEVIGRHPKGARSRRHRPRESEKWGESPVAIVVRSDESLEGEEILEFCQDKLARFKQPVAVHFIDQLPRNPSGKILKRLLRETVQLSRRRQLRVGQDNNHPVRARHSPPGFVRRRRVP